MNMASPIVIDLVSDSESAYDLMSYASDASDSDSDSSYDDAASDDDDDDDDPMNVPEPRMSVRKRAPISADVVFVRSVTAFFDTFYAATARYNAMPAHRREPESVFCRRFNDSLSLLVGSHSAWIHDTRTREQWQNDIRAATTIDAFTEVVARLVLVLRHPAFVKARATMTTFFDGLDKMEKRFG